MAGAGYRRRNSRRRTIRRTATAISARPAVMAVAALVPRTSGHTSPNGHTDPSGTERQSGQRQCERECRQCGSRQRWRPWRRQNPNNHDATLLIAGPWSSGDDNRPCASSGPICYIARRAAAEDQASKRMLLMWSPGSIASITSMPSDSLAEDRMHAVEVRLRLEHEEELRAAGIAAGMGHGKRAGLVLVRIALGLAGDAPARPAPLPVAVGAAALRDEAFDHAVEGEARHRTRWWPGRASWPRCWAPRSGNSFELDGRRWSVSITQPVRLFSLSAAMSCFFSGSAMASALLIGWYGQVAEL